MKKVIIDVKDENLNTLITILENLRSGLIDKVDYEGKKTLSVKYIPKSKEIIKEGSKPKGKYLSKNEYQERKTKIL